MTTVRLELSGDQRLSARERRQYLAAGLKELATHFRSKARARHFELDLADPTTEQTLRDGASPFRVYTTGISQIMAHQYLHNASAILDIGCGSGAHARFFKGLPRSVIYVGLDIALHGQWTMTQPGSDPIRFFVQTSAVDPGIRSGSIAYSYSSSALEHVPNLNHAVLEIARTMAPGSYGLHLVPGVWALPLYMFHGYRRFSPAGLQALFQGAGLQVKDMWSLGGLGSFLLHFVWIACLETALICEWLPFAGIPSIMRRVVPSLGPRARRGLLLRLYSSLLRAALLVDRRLPLLPTGYAVLIRKPAESPNW